MSTLLLPPKSTSEKTLTLTMTRTMTRTSYLDLDPDHDQDHDQLMHGMRQGPTRDYGKSLAESVVHGKAEPPTPVAGFTHWQTCHTAPGGLERGLPVHASFIGELSHVRSQEGRLTEGRP